MVLLPGKGHPSFSCGVLASPAGRDPHSALGLSLGGLFAQERVPSTFFYSLISLQC